MDEYSCTWSWYYTVIALITAYLFITVSWCFTYFNAYFTLNGKLVVLEVSAPQTPMPLHRRNNPSVPLATREVNGPQEAPQPARLDGRKVKTQRSISVEEPYIVSKMKEIRDNFGTPKIVSLKGEELAKLKVNLFLYLVFYKQY